MKVRFLPEADVEFRESARYFEDKAPGLGVAFIAEVHRVAAVVATQPSIGSPVEDELRKFVLRRFPYNVIYALRAMRLSSPQSRITRGAHSIGAGAAGNNCVGPCEGWLILRMQTMKRQAATHS